MSGNGTRNETELSRQVSELRREVTETRNQMIKTANGFANLTTEVHEISRLLGGQKRGLHFNSVAAYVLFVLLIAGGAYLMYTSRIERVDFEKGVLMRERAAARSKLETALKQVEQRRTTEQRALAFYRLSQSGKVFAALKQYPEVAQMPLSPVESALFQAWATSTRSRLSHSAFTEAMKAVEQKQWKEAVINFQRSVKFVPQPNHEASLRYYYGIALNRLGSYPEAAAELERSIEVGSEKNVNREVRFYLGSIYETMGQFKKARAAYEAYIQRYPGSKAARAARRRLRQLE